MNEHRKNWLICFLPVTMTWLTVSGAMVTTSPINETVEVKEKEYDSRNTYFPYYTMTHIDLVAKVIEIEKELRSHNKRISSQEKVNEEQDKKILSIEERSRPKKREAMDEAVVNNYAPLKEILQSPNMFKKGENNDGVLRIKRQEPQKLIKLTIAKFSPYPDYPDIYYRRGNYLAEPTNCNDLKLIGHFMNGFYSVKNAFNNGNIDTVFCNFTRPFEALEDQTFFGVKRGSFLCSKKNPWNEVGVITFDTDRLNVGGAMKSSTGIFTAPKTGVYHFVFSGIRNKDAANTFIELRRGVGENTEKIALAYGDNTLRYGSLSLSATIKLQKGDEITIFNSGKGGGLYDDSDSYTSFTGSLLMDENMA